jgi:hypothetical protein
MLTIGLGIRMVIEHLPRMCDVMDLILLPKKINRKTVISEPLKLLEVGTVRIYKAFLCFLRVGKYPVHYFMIE